MRPESDQASILARYMEGPALLRRTLAGLADTDLDAAPAKGGWTIRQIVHHIADGDDIWKAGIKQALGNDRSEYALDWYRVQTQDTWAERWAYRQRPVDTSLSLIEAIRNHVWQLIEHIPGGWDKTLVLREPSGETVSLSVGFIIGMQADHLVHHVKHIEAILNTKHHR